MGKADGDEVLVFCMLRKVFCNYRAILLAKCAVRPLAKEVI
jgi:hypothetical protein